MRCRLAIVAVLAAGVLLSGGGAALGASALMTDLTATAAQYGASGPQNVQQPIGPPERLGPAVVPQPAPVVQAPRQIALPVGGLPFTGYAAIPLLLVGTALLTAGFALRRRTAAHP